MKKQIIELTSDGRKFITMPNNSSNPCKSCGVCCNHFRISFYFGELDCQPNGFVPVDLTDKVNNFFSCMKGTISGGRCIALEGSPQDGNISCSIYNNRPTPCREFPVFMPDGNMNPKCNELREKFGLKKIHS